MCLKFPYCHLKDCLMIQCDHPSDNIAHILVLLQHFCTCSNFRELMQGNSDMLQPVSKPDCYMELWP